MDHAEFLTKLMSKSQENIRTGRRKDERTDGQILIQ